MENFKTLEQLQAVYNHSFGKNDLIYTAGTGSGKSLVFMMGAVLHPTKTTVLVVPLIPLKQQMIERLKADNILVSDWTGTAPNANPQILVVSVEATGTVAFDSYLATLYQKEKLLRVVIDEAHLLVTSEFRPFIKKALQIRKRPFPLTFLTATLPPKLSDEIQTEIHNPNPVIIRGPSDRTNLRYQVKNLSTVKEMKEWTLKKVADSKLLLKSHERIIIYVMTIADGTELARHIQGSVLYYHDLAEKEKNADLWTTGEAQIMICTNAFGCGINYPHVHLVISYGGSNNLLYYAQESGRGGRDGVVTDIILVTTPSYLSRFGNALSEITDYINTNQCRRQHLIRHTDAVIPGPCLLIGELCDNCSIIAG